MVPVVEQLNMPAIAITDHGSMSATYDLHKAAKDSPVKPIYGIEAYVAPESRTLKEPVFWGEGGGNDVSGKGAYTHMTLLAETDEGLHNLFRLSSQAYLDGFYRHPRMDDELLAKYGKGIIATTGCPSGAVQTWLRIGNYDKAVEAAAKYRDIFGKENYFVELMDHGLGIEKEVIPQLMNIAKDLGLRTVATNDTHYIHKNDSAVHDALLCIGSGSKLQDKDRFSFEGTEFYIKSPEEMRNLWDDYAPDACDSTLLIAERCTAAFGDGADLMPEFPVPEGETESTLLAKEVQRGLELRYPDGVPEDRQKQAEYEVGIINQMGFPGYFLVTADFINWAKEQGIRVGPGRGSAAGSIIAYAMGITDIDPMKHGLMFERFLNPERVSMPDIDVDFDDRRRGEVIDYVIQKYGEDKVANIATFGTIKAKAAIKDAARVLSMPYMLGDKLTKAYPQPIVGRDLSLKDAYDPAHERYDDAKEFRQLVENDADSRETVELAKGLEGVRRGFGMHAAGVIMSKQPLVETVPLMRRDANSPLMTQFEYPTCEYLGLLKMDFLGLSNLGTIDEALRLIKQNKGVDVDLDEISETLDDKKTFEMVSRGETLGVFQLDSPPMRSLLQTMEPDSFEDISAVLALYRPGPMGAGTHIEYAERKNGRRPIEPIHPELAEPLAEILGDTYGLIVYQEQVMAIAQQLAGYTLGQADLLRRAMGKKDPAVLAKEFIPFKQGMLDNGYSEESIQTLWDILVPFSDYAFNRAHTAGYGLVSYWTAYLKANFPAEYMAALLTTNSDNKDKLALYLAECRYQQIEVLPPDINESELNYTAIGDAIRVGLIGIKNLGEKAIRLWIEEREANGPAKSFTDFLERATAGIGTKKVVESIIKAGAFDSFPENRASLFAVVDDAITAAKKNKKLREKASDSLFGAEEFKLELDIPALPEWEKMELLSLERDILGLYVSDHPLAEYQSAIETLSSTSIADLKQRDNPPQGQLKLAALVTNIDRKTTRKAGDPWALVTVEDMDASLNLYVFPKTYADVRDLLEVDKILLFTGKVEKRDDGSTNFIVQAVSTPDMQAVSRKVNRREERVERGDLTPEEAEALATGPTIADDGTETPVLIRAHEEQLTEALVEKLKDAIIEFQGSRPVHMEITRSDRTKVLYALGDDFKVVGAAQFAAEVRSLFGPDAI
jgi:DNA polymerase-3 subunit alpha